jgi:tetratricopeptide (TPR) repeat protein
VDQSDPRRLAEAASLAAEGVNTFVKLEGDKNLGKAAGLFETALVMRELNPGVAEKQLRESLALARATVAPQHIGVALILHELAYTLMLENKNEEAEQTFQECLEVVRSQVGLEHPRAMILVSSYAALLSRRGKREQGEKLYQELLDAQQTRFGEKHFFVANSLTAYASFLARHDDVRCEQILDRALRIYRESGNQRRLYYLRAVVDLGDLCLRHDRYAEAERLHREALDQLRQRYGETSERTARVEDSLAFALLHQGRADKEVETLLLSALATYEGLAAEQPSRYAKTLGHVGWYYRETGRPADAAAAALRRRQCQPDDPEQLFAAACDLAHCVPLVGKGRSQLGGDEEAERAKCADEAVATLKQAVDKGFRDERRLAKEAALDPLRTRADFQDLVKRLE